ncbi:MAG: hypothetical protein ACRCS9_06195 [Hyphomicrobium sp.]
MSDELKAKGQDFAKYIAALTPEQLADGNRRQVKHAQAEYDQFLKRFQSGDCYLCIQPLKYFDRATPCLHWLLKPDGFRKSDLPALAEKFGFFQFQSFLRWVANTAAFARNINDLPEEGSGNKLFEATIRYKETEWSFSCGESDYAGHPNSRSGRLPHYHLQMRINRRPFINFNDYHLPFSDMDVVHIEATRAVPDFAKHQVLFGEGLKDVLNEDTLRKIVPASVPATDPDNADYHIQSFVQSDPGTAISGDEIYALQLEARSKNVQLASLLHKLKHVQISIAVMPGPATVEQATRTGRKRDKEEPT